MTNETTRVQKFIDVHKNLVLHDAIKDLESCDLSNIPRLLHRLKGTLGTFQFRYLTEQLDELLTSVKSEKSPRDLAVARDHAITVIKDELQRQEIKK